MNYKKRRDTLIELVRMHHPDKCGPIVFFAPCDDPTQNFVQDANFYYFSGIVEPASVVIMHHDQHDFYYPAYTALRHQWVATPVAITEQYIQAAGFDHLRTTGASCAAIHIYPYFDISLYENIIALLRLAVERKENIFTVYGKNNYETFVTAMIIDRLAMAIPGLLNSIVDISPLIAHMRRKKDMSEIETLYKAVDITTQAHCAAVAMLKAGNTESDMQAALEYVFTEHQAVPAYPSIVGSGSAGTILHYTMNNKKLVDGDCVVVDAGARYNYYCADITRTYPVSGTFTQEQKDLYEMVLHAQELVAENAKPGVWLFNKDEQEASLHHIALRFFQQQGYDQYFPHGVGHFLGLQVHDVGDRSIALQEGDIITIEPGIYIPEKKLGIRIEDNYWIVDQTTPVCLSEALPKTVSAIEVLVKDSFDVDLE